MKKQSNARWYEAEDGTVYQSLVPLIDYLDTTQSRDTEAIDLHEWMYAGLDVGSEDASDIDNAEKYEPSTISRNIARSAVDTYVAKVFRHRPLPEVIANKGDWKALRRARKMTQLVEGQFDRDKIFKKWARLIGRDAGKTGRGILKIDLEKLDSKCIRCERIKPRELRVDRADAKYGAPRNIYLVRDIDAGVLKRAFGDEAKTPDGEPLDMATVIDTAAAKWTSERQTVEQQSTVSRVRVVEAWHLCDDEEAHELKEEHECTGRHTVSIMGADLVDEDWPFDRFPFAILNFDEPDDGYFGVGLCERLEGYQLEQALMSKKVSDSHYYAGGGIIWLGPGSAELVEEDFTNSVWKVLRGGTQAPTFLNPEPLHPATYQYHRDLRGDAFADIGLNEMAAGGQTPMGESGIAKRVTDEVQDVRLGMQGYQYAQWCVDVAELQLMWIQHIAKTHGNYEVDVPLKGGVLPLTWKDVAIDNFILRVHPSALMRTTPSGLRQTAQELFNANQIDGFTFMRMIDQPDIEGEIDVLLASRMRVDEEIEAMLDAEDPSDPAAYRPPSPYSTDLEWSKRRCIDRLAQADMQGCPEENLELLRDRILDTLALEERIAGAPLGGPMMPPGGGPPPAAMGGQPVPPAQLPPGAPPGPPGIPQ